MIFIFDILIKNFHQKYDPRDVWCSCVGRSADDAVLPRIFESISHSDAKVALIVAAPLSTPLCWKFNFSKIWRHMLLYLKTDCSYTDFSFLYVQTSSNIKKMRFYGLIWIIRPSKILLRLQEIAISCNLKQRTVESDLNKVWPSFYIPRYH